MATIHDVARAAGVSAATVSRVLNQPRVVAPQTAARVRAVIEELDFRPDLRARDFRRGASHMIGLLVGDIAQPFHGALAKSVERAAEQSGYGVMLCDLDHREERLLAFLRGLPSRGLAGVLLASADDLGTPAMRSAIVELDAKGVRVVTAGQTLDSLDLPAVVLDYERVGQDAATHLVDLGCNPLVALMGGRRSWFSRAVGAGVRAAARASSVPVHTVDGGFQHEAARRGIGRLLARGVRPGGIIAANTPMAIGASRALHEGGLDIPADVALVVCEDVPSAEYLRPSLTAVDTDLAALGAISVQVLLRRIEGQEVEARTVLTHSLVPRESSARASSSARLARPSSRRTA